MTGSPVRVTALSLIALTLLASLVTAASAGSAPATPVAGAAPTLEGFNALSSAVLSLSGGHGPASGAPASCSPVAGGSASCSFVLGPSSGGGTAPPLWTNQTKFQAHAPSPRILGSMVWDAKDGYVLLFGGCTTTTCTGTPFGDTWTFQNDEWTQLNVTGAPSARSIGMMTYDAADKEVVMFGGLDTASSAALNETWTYRAGVWTNLTPKLAVSPPAGYRAAMTYDGSDGYVLLFGGTIYGSTTPSAQSWKFVHNTWTSITANVTGTPPGVYRATMTYDAHDGYVVMFGGCTAKVCPEGYTYLYHNLTWTNLTSSLKLAPSSRVYPQMTYDARDGYVLLFSGTKTTTGPPTGGTWAFSGGAWTNLSSSFPGGGAPLRGEGMLAWDGSDDQALLFGGVRGATLTTLMGDTWSFGPSVVTAPSTVAAPFTGISSKASSPTSVTGCGSTAFAHSVVRPSFNETTGAIGLGSAASTGCGSTTAPTSAAASENLLLTGPDVRVSANGSYWINATLNLTFSLKIRDACHPGCTKTNFGDASYGIWANATLFDQNVHRAIVLHTSSGLSGYVNGTSVGRSTITVTYRNVPVRFYVQHILLASHVYQFRISLTEQVSVAAMGATGKAALTLDLGAPRDGAWLQGLSVS